jgi:hypothetical protein
MADASNGYRAGRTDGQGYDLKVTFAVDSLGQTEYDGDWELEDVYVPGQGLHWTAPFELYAASPLDGLSL